jgi:hypothetical protein
VRRIVALALAACGIAWSTSAGAQGAPAPWRPAGLDSARAWGLEARSLLDQSTADTITTRESRAFQLLGRIARKHFEALGPGGMRGAAGVLAVYDSLKLDVELAQDPVLPQFCAVTFFNPKFAGYAAITYLFWWRGNELLSQPLRLTGGRHIEMRVWWTGNELGPYEMGLVDFRRTVEPRDGYFTMLRMSRKADFWGVIQMGRKDLDLGGPGTARFVDLDNDPFPELVHWGTSAPDPRFVVDVNLPPLLSEQIWRRADTGFELLDRHTVATPFATFVLFLRALESGQTQLARSLVATPAILTRARTLKLGMFHAAGSWRAIEFPQGGRWHDWMRFQYGTPPRLDRVVEIRLKEVEGHWVIDKLEAVGGPPAGAPAGTKPKATTGSDKS